MEHTKWVVIDSGGRVMKKAVGEPQIICTLETKPLKISPEIEARAKLIAAAPELLAACEWTARGEHHSACIHHKNYLKCGCYVEAAKQAIKAAK